ncbi:hypothetical protein [Sporosarcina highlanderae]|uniref:DUF4825 domain-containing protein n=1 Tax=Sporosarcina highlanderae TaxID=3035916 RepID=A0ABT8JTU0_9BACL|nr:hypothetical protein [Sporosarcina highlanderae]MDN4608560.1 hypothetical protein [Sporosarcina highlanderae]
MDDFLKSNIHFTNEEGERIKERIAPKKKRALRFNPVYWTVLAAAASLFIFISISFINSPNEISIGNTSIEGDEIIFYGEGVYWNVRYIYNPELYAEKMVNWVEIELRNSELSPEDLNNIDIEFEGRDGVITGNVGGMVTKIQDNVISFLVGTVNNETYKEDKYKITIKFNDQQDVIKLKFMSKEFVSKTIYEAETIIQQYIKYLNSKEWDEFVELFNFDHEGKEELLSFFKDSNAKSKKQGIHEIENVQLVSMSLSNDPEFTSKGDYVYDVFLNMKVHDNSEFYMNGFTHNIFVFNKTGSGLKLENVYFKGLAGDKQSNYGNEDITVLDYLEISDGKDLTLVLEQSGREDFHLKIERLPVLLSYLTQSDNPKLELSRMQSTFILTHQEKDYFLVSFNCGVKLCDQLLVEHSSKDEVQSIEVSESSIFQDVKQHGDHLALLFGRNEGVAVMRNHVVLLNLKEFIKVSPPQQLEVLESFEYPITRIEWKGNDLKVVIADLKEPTFENIMEWNKKNGEPIQELLWEIN